MRQTRTADAIPRAQRYAEPKASGPLGKGAVLGGRVSREGQDLAQQRAALRGSRMHSPVRREGLRWLDHLRPGDVVVVRKLDRLSRSLKDLQHIMEQIGEAGADLRSLTEHIDTTTPAGRMMRWWGRLPSSNGPWSASAHLLASPLPGPRDASAGGARSWTTPPRDRRGGHIGPEDCRADGADVRRIAADYFADRRCSCGGGLT
jgi:hypothetical protein